MVSSPGQEVADVRGEHVRPLLLEQGATVAGADRVVVTAEGLLALVDLTDEVAAVHRHGEARDRAACGERERVDGLDRTLLLRVVAVALSDDRASVAGDDLRTHVDAEERHRATIGVEAGLLVSSLRAVLSVHRFRPPSFTFDIASKISSISFTSLTDLSGASSATVRSTPGKSSMRRNMREA